MKSPPEKGLLRSARVRSAWPRVIFHVWRVGLVFQLLLVLLLVAERADAFCGFYVSGADAKLFNNATQVVMMREGTRTVLSMQNNYQGPPSNFAMVVPVPVVLQKENVKTLARDIFAKVDQLDAPRLVEYWEQDPCSNYGYPEAKGGAGGGSLRKAAGAKDKAADDLGVTVEAQFTVGEYEVVILSAKDAAGLETWLKQEKYTIPDGSEPLFRPYVQAGSKFFVARVDVTKVTFEGPEDKKMATLSPLRFHYDSPEFSLPVRLGLVNSSGTQDLIVHILAKNQRYEVANYPNATIPTNLDVAENAREKFGSFYASLFDRTLEKNPKAVITEYSWDASTCDPCPGPALSFNDLATLGADALPSASPDGTTPPPPAGSKGPRGFRGMRPSGFTITRLHARYSKESLGQDLVFRAATPILGGREHRSGEKNELEHGSTATTGANNFQGRYAIRHPWGGPIECKEPIRNRWGGPPQAQRTAQLKGGEGSPKAAKDLAFVPRDVKLASFVRSEIPELGIKPEGLAVSPVLPLAPTGTTTTPSENPSVLPAPSAGTAGANKKSGCGCMTIAPSPSFASFGAGALGVVVLLMRRRRAHR